MTASDLVAQLAAHRTLGGAPRAELQWLADHGCFRELDAGEIVYPKGGSIDSLVIVFSGRIAIFVDRGAGRHKLTEWRAGDVTGVLPYSRMVAAPGRSVALEPTTVLSVAREHFPELVRECQEVTTILVHTMLDRARLFNASDLHDEKMASLGKLSAGLAHELNNPASAIERGAVVLEERLGEVERTARALGRLRLADAQLATAEKLRQSCLAVRGHGVRSPIEQAEREEAMSDWLADRGFDTAAADALADTEITVELLDGAAAALDPAAMDVVLRWAAAGCLARQLVADIQEAATRITGLVLAIKGFTHMDQATLAEPVDLARSLENTIAVLRSKARSRSAALGVAVEPDLPPVHGFVGELNQIWSNLIDNALDAIGDGGRVDVTASRDGNQVVVRVVDNGAGIPEDIRDRIFDPFFTTKPVGQGTGLGLDIVRRLVLHNDGEITVESRPGRTEFRVVLQAVTADASGAAP
jgi:signal transduction histidine kinase